MPILVPHRQEMRLLKWLLLLATLMIGAVVMLLRFTDILPNPWESILPLMGASTSKSLEPYTLSLKAEIASHSDGYPPTIVEWRLSLPRSYVYMEIGNKEIASNNEHTYIVKLAAIRTKDTNTFSPGVLANSIDMQDVSLISLYSSAASEKISRPDFCVRVNDRDAVLRDGSAGMPGCDVKKPRSKRCSVRTNYRGWDVDILMPVKNYTTDYQIYCRSVLRFLEKKTEHITELPVGIQ